MFKAHNSQSSVGSINTELLAMQFRTILGVTIGIQQWQIPTIEIKNRIIHISFLSQTQNINVDDIFNVLKKNPQINACGLRHATSSKLITVTVENYSNFLSGLQELANLTQNNQRFSQYQPQQATQQYNQSFPQTHQPQQAIQQYNPMFSKPQQQQNNLSSSQQSFQQTTPAPQQMTQLDYCNQVSTLMKQLLNIYENSNALTVTIQNNAIISINFDEILISEFQKALQTVFSESESSAYGLQCFKNEENCQITVPYNVWNGFLALLNQKYQRKLFEQSNSFNNNQQQNKNKPF